MMLFLSDDLEAILRWLRKMFLKDNILEKAVTPFKLVKIDVKKTGDQRLIDQVTIWIYFFIFVRFDNWPMHKLILFGGLYALIYIQIFIFALLIFIVFSKLILSILVFGQIEIIFMFYQYRFLISITIKLQKKKKKISKSYFLRKLSEWYVIINFFWKSADF